jgi:hypothetical protein
MAKKRIDPEELRQARQVSRQFREMVERRAARLAAWDEAERLRKERLQRWTFGLLGRG